MGKTTNITPVMAHGENLKEVSARFKRWRETRVRGQHLPRQLWVEAVELAHKHGVEAVAGTLRVDVERLKARLEPAGDGVQGRKGDTQFVEMRVAPMTPSAPRCDCAVEVQNARGARMRVELNGDGLASLAGLCSAIWSAT
jgi:hypothetical protein